MDIPNNSRNELRKLYPKLTEEEIAETKERLDRYLKLAIEIIDRKHDASS